MTPDIKINDLERAVRMQRSDIDVAVRRVLDSGWYVLGPENAALEHELSEAIGVPSTVLVASGTDALQLALAGVGVSAGDHVFTVANAGGYATTAIVALGATPHYADVDPETLLMSQASLERAVDRDGVAPAAVVVTHLFGRSAPVDEIVAWAHSRGIRVVEDVAQAMGGVWGGRPLGSFGDAAITSFYPTKNLGALGDGGAVFTADPDVATRVRRLRQYGWSEKYVVAEPHGRNSRMDEIQAAVVRMRLPLLESLNARRRAIHARYEAANPGVMTASVAHDFVGHLAVLQVDDRPKAVQSFRERGIGTDIHYPVPDHRQPAWATSVSLPVTERASSRVLSVPLFPELTEAEIDAVCAALAELPPGALGSTA